MGRPTLYTTPLLRRSALLREEAVEALEQAAAQQGRPRARLMADAIELYLAANVDGFDPIVAPDCPDGDQPTLGLDAGENDLEACA